MNTEINWREDKWGWSWWSVDWRWKAVRKAVYSGWNRVECLCHRIGKGSSAVGRRFSYFGHIVFDIGAWQKSHGQRISYTFWTWGSESESESENEHTSQGEVDGVSPGLGSYYIVAARWTVSQIECQMLKTECRMHFPARECRACLDLFPIVRRLALMAEASPPAAAFPADRRLGCGI